MHFLIVTKLTERQQNTLKEDHPEITFTYQQSASVTKEDLVGVDAVFGNVPEALLLASPTLRWVQLSSAGYDHYGTLSKQCVTTSSVGAYGLALSEHAIGGILFLQKNFGLYRENQKHHVWHDEGSVRSIYGSRTLVVGLGNVGQTVAEKLDLLGSTVVGIKRDLSHSVPHVKELHTMDDLNTLLPQMDIVVLCLPKADGTTHIINGENLPLFKQNAILVNIGRGTVVDQKALVGALKGGKLSGCVLDVFEQEPLPSDDPLWDCPNAFLTPHVAGGFHLAATQEAVFRIFQENLSHFLQGEPLRNVVR